MTEKMEQLYLEPVVNRQNNHDRDQADRHQELPSSALR
jgi:hypothetical protein